jgi:hypothetical protein
MRIAVILIALLVINGICVPDARAQRRGINFTWGINGHPLTQSAYHDNLEEQIKYLKDLKLNSYRFDVLLGSDGHPQDEQAFNTLLKKLSASNISALPVLMQRGLKGLDDTALYKASYIQGENFGLRYGKYLSVVEVNNEADNKILLPGNLSGRTEKDYDPRKAKRVILAIKGFIDGLKANNAKIKVTLSVSYTHYYYLQLLADNLVNYDIIGCHWYSDMGDIANSQPFGDNVLAKITERFKKPIWITEFNHGKGTAKVGLDVQNAYIKSAITKMLSQHIITGLFIYELFDQSDLKSKYPNEANYGLISRANNIYSPKDAYNGFKQIIQQGK